MSALLTKKRLVVVEDDILLQAFLIKMLNSQADLECLFAVSSAEDAVEKIPASNPDVILMDIRLTGMSGIECLPILRPMVPDAQILMLTSHDDDDSIIQALRAGADGYLVKSVDPDTLFNAIRELHMGGAPLSGHIARKVVQFFHGRSLHNSRNPTSCLTKREAEVLELLATGCRYKEVGEILRVSPETVRTYVKRICAKMHVRNRTEAIVKYLA